MSKDIKNVSLNYEDWRVFGNVWHYEDFVELLANLLDDNKLILGGDILQKDEAGFAYSGCGLYYEGQSVLDSNIEAQKYLGSIAKWAEREKLYISISLKFNSKSI